MAYGEFSSGTVNSEKNVLFVNHDHGIGLGILINGQLYYGKSGFAGEFGHIPFFNNELICHCGKKGCLETEASGQALLRKFQEKLKEGLSSAVMRKHKQPEQVTLTFEKGELSGVNDKTFSHPAEAIMYLQSIAGPFAIGRDVHVGDTIIGIKGRVGFEAAAPMVILKAHHALEKHVLTKWQLSWKDQLAQFYGNWMHEGQILDPVMRDIEAFLQHSQQQVTGKVFVTLMPYRFQVTGIESAYDLMSSKFGKYGEMNSGWSGEDVRGFSKIFGNQTMIWHQVNEENNK